MPTLEKVLTPCLRNIMVQLCDDNGFILSSKVLLPADSFIHVSEAWGSVSWLDHIVSSSDFNNCIKTVSIDHDLSERQPPSHLSGKGAAVFAEGLSGAVASGLGKVRYLN